MLNLIVKDFRLLFSAQGNLRKKLLSILTTVLMMAAVVGIETYIFTTILDKIRVYHNASLPFLTLFLGIISVFMILITTLRANTMNDWSKYLDNILTMSGEQLLQDAGNVTHEQAMEHATEEYRKYKQRTISDVEKDYLFSIKGIEKLNKRN